MARQRKYSTPEEAAEANRIRSRERSRALKPSWDETKSLPYMQEKHRIAAEAKSKGCYVCGEKEMCTLDFHHRDPSQKEFNLSWHLFRRNGLGKFTEELAKCTVLCSNCHRKVHAGLLFL